LALRPLALPANAQLLAHKDLSLATALTIATIATIAIGRCQVA
jgi:hypothetical protein